MEKNKAIDKLKDLLKNNENKRIVVVGTSCIGKSTILKEISGAQDMDELIFPRLSKKEKDYVCKSPWTEEIGKTMNRLVREKLKVKKGRPFFGTVILNYDLVIYLDISDELLKERAKKRRSSFVDIKNMQKSILKEIKELKIPCIKIKVD